MRDNGTLLGIPGIDILLGWFASGPIFVSLWIAGGLVLRGLRLVAQIFGAKFDISSAEGWDKTIFLCDAIAIVIAFSTLIVLRRKYPYLAWSCGIGMLPFCVIWSFLADRSQYWH